MKVKIKREYPKLKTDLSIKDILYDKEYKVLLIEFNLQEELYRIINEKNEPTLYPAVIFKIIDGKIDINWKFHPLAEKYYPERLDTYLNNEETFVGYHLLTNGIWYIGPKEFAYNYYFFRDWFNNKKKERKVLKDFLESYPEYKNVKL